jgi:polyisoprenoid-binding protein YceI
MFADRPENPARRFFPLSQVVRVLLIPVLIACLNSPSSAQSQDIRLEFAPANTTINFTLGDVLHTVHGSFKLKRGEVQYTLGAPEARGELVIDTTSGQSGNHSRDRKMHREILESATYPEIVFHPDRVYGTVAPTGVSTVQVHGIFSIHGGNHELSLPIRIDLARDHWIADTHFTIPYVKWGLKNPSTFLLRVSESVEVDIHATGGDPLVAMPH